MDQTTFFSCLEKQNKVKQLFLYCATPEDKYKKLIEIGQDLTPISPAAKVPENAVSGCQSLLYLSSCYNDQKIIFTAASDALISAGLAALLIMVYSEEPPEVVLKCPPHYLQELGIQASLSPNRSNGLANIYLRMKQEALKFLALNIK